MQERAAKEGQLICAWAKILLTVFSGKCEIQPGGIGAIVSLYPLDHATPFGRKEYK